MMQLEEKFHRHKTSSGHLSLFFLRNICSSFTGDSIAYHHVK